MEAKDLTTPLPSCNSSCKSEDGELHISNCDPKDADSEPSKLEVKGDKSNREIPGTSEADVGNYKGQFLQAAELVCVLNGGSSALQDSVELNETVAVAEDTGILSSRIQSEKGCLNVQDGSPISSQKRNGSPVSNSICGVKAGVKRARMKVDDQQPSVLVTYNFLTRDSKRKLEELLQHWSEWHAQHCSLPHDTSEVLESGENKYFPALRFGLGNSSSVSFWMDNQSRNWHEKELIPMEGNSVPLYDRGYSLALTSTDGSSNREGRLEIIDGSRCFNCGSYNHSLKDCTKPRDNAAVNSARKQHKSRRNQNASSRNSTRYYQDSPQGKYDGLRPGVLDAETRNLLGLGELDPPPWLNRMREIGYPPGYLDTEDEAQPSGITIFADEEMKEEKEDGEILEAAHPESPRKMRVPRNMSVEFPGLNAPIPENADERRWAAGRSSLDSSRNRSHRRKGMGDNRLPLEPPTYSSEPITRGQYYHEQRWSRDDGPPGCDPGFSPTYSSFTPRYGDYDSGHHSQSARGNISTPQSPRFGRSLSDRGRWNPLVYEDSPNSGSYSSAPYSPPSRQYPPRYDSLSSEKRDDSRWRENDPNFSSHAKDNKHDRHHHHSRR